MRVNYFLPWKPWAPAHLSLLYQAPRGEEWLGSCSLIRGNQTLHSFMEISNHPGQCKRQRISNEVGARKMVGE